MKIKIKPYPNFKLSDEVFQRDVASNFSTGSLELTNEDHVAIVSYRTGEKKFHKTRLVEQNGNFYFSTFPNLVHIFLSAAIEHNERSNEIKKINFAKCGKKTNQDNVFLLDSEVDGTHPCYNSYIESRILSIIMLVCAIEAYLNQIIDDDFLYKNENGKEFNKKAIEGMKINFQEKILHVLPQWLKNPDFWKEDESARENILELYEIRKNIIHLKTNSDSIINRYSSTLDKIMNFNIHNSIVNVIKMMNLARPDFVELE